MRFSKLISAQHDLLRPRLISVEIDISKGLHAFSIVGLPDKAVEESRDRVSAAIKNTGFKSPKQTNAKITVSLAPADIRKGGPAFDLPIALGYLLAAGEISFDPQGKLFVGELALDGKVRPIEGALSYARLAQTEGLQEIYLPVENAREAALIEDIDIFGVECLGDLIGHLDPERSAEAACKLEPAPRTEYISPSRGNASIDFDDIVGQETAKRGLMIAAAGRHNIALYGPPGTGKTMLARALAAIMPPLDYQEVLEATEIHSIAGTLDGDIVAEPPLRAPHHTSSYASLVGGGTYPRPGEITLAHHGILFMDEFPEFDKRVIEALRQPLEDKVILIARGGSIARFPADFILIAALNPCPCGNLGAPGKECRCSPSEVRRYGKKISGPIIDRIDMWIEVYTVEHEKLIAKRGSIETDRARKAIEDARRIQKERFGRLGISASANASIPPRDLARACSLSQSAIAALNGAAERYGLSARGYHRVARLARTIADISGSQSIEAPHILEALQYRQRHMFGTA